MKDILERSSSVVVSSMETYFQWYFSFSEISRLVLTKINRHGIWVASHPAKTILASFALCGLFGLGLLNFHQETNMVRLWFPQVKYQLLKIYVLMFVGFRFCATHGLVVGASPYRRGIQVNDPHKTFFTSHLRYHSLLLRAEDNVLTPATLQVHFTLHSISSTNGRQFWKCTSKWKRSVVKFEG